MLETVSSDVPNKRVTPDKKATSGDVASCCLTVKSAVSVHWNVDTVTVSAPVKDTINVISCSAHDFIAAVSSWGISEWLQIKK